MLKNSTDRTLCTEKQPILLQLHLQNAVNRELIRTILIENEFWMFKHCYLSYCAQNKLNMHTKQ